MTVAHNEDVTANYEGDGATTEWVFPFPVFDNVDIFVDGLEVAFVANGAGDGFVLTPAPAEGAVIKTIRATRIDQPVDYEDLEEFPGDNVEKSLDKITYILQEKGAGILAIQDALGLGPQGFAVPFEQIGAFDDDIIGWWIADQDCYFLPESTKVFAATRVAFAADKSVVIKKSVNGAAIGQFDFEEGGTQGTMVVEGGQVFIAQGTAIEIHPPAGGDAGARDFACTLAFVRA